MATENVVTVGEVKVGDENARKTGTAYEVDSRGQDIPIWWTATGPRGYGYGAQPYDDSQYGGALPPDFLGWEVEMAVYDGGDGTGKLTLVDARSLPPRQMTFIWREEENCAAVARLGLGFQSVVQFTVRGVTKRGRSLPLSVISVKYSGNAWAKGFLKWLSPKWLFRGLIIWCVGEDYVPLKIYRGSATATSNLLELRSETGTLLNYFDKDGSLSIGGGGGSGDMTTTPTADTDNEVIPGNNTTKALSLQSPSTSYTDNLFEARSSAGAGYEGVEISTLEAAAAFVMRVTQLRTTQPGLRAKGANGASAAAFEVTDHNDNKLFFVLNDGTVSFSSQRARSVATPVDGTDGANKSYVDSVAADFLDNVAYFSDATYEYFVGDLATDHPSGDWKVNRYDSSNTRTEAYGSDPPDAKPTTLAGCQALSYT